MEGPNQGEQYVNQKTERSHHKLGENDPERMHNAREADRNLMRPFIDIEYLEKGVMLFFNEKLNNNKIIPRIINTIIFF